MAIAIVAFLLLRTVIWAWASGAEWAAKDRVVTRHKVTFVMTLPKRYVEDVRNAPHVKAVTWANWFGGKDPKHDREFFAALAVDPATYFVVYDEMKVPPDQMETWKHDKQGAIVGDVLAKKMGWKVGDQGHPPERHLPRRLAVQHRRHLRGDGALGRPLDLPLPLGLPERRAAAGAARPRWLDREPRRRPRSRRGHRRGPRQASSRTATRRRCRRTSAASTRRSSRCSRRSSRRWTSCPP